MKRKVSRRKGIKNSKLKPADVVLFDKDIFDVLHALKSFTDEELAKEAKVEKITIRRLRNGPKYGGTRFPRHTTYQRLLRVAKKHFVIRDLGSND
jgi:hypothetical protein